MYNLNLIVIDKIKKVRLAKGISQKEIANALHLSSNAYSRIEKGDTQLTINNLEIISEVIGLSVSKLIVGDGDKKEIANYIKIMKKIGGILLSTDQFAQLCLLLQKKEM